MDGFKNLVSESNFGLIDKAVIKVIQGTSYNSFRNGDSKGESAGVKLAGPNLSSVKITKGGSSMNIGSITEGAVWGSSAATMSKYAEALGGLAASVTDAFSEYGKTFTVPFNPASFSLSGNAGGRVENTDFTGTRDGKKGNIVSFEPAPLTIRLDVDLVLNDVDPSDAFIETNATNIKGISKTVGKTIGKTDEHSIRKEVEGLLAATRSFSTSLISFNWGAMTYYGELERLQAEYKMFNPAGEPIAGTVHMTVLLIDRGVNEKSMGKWYKAYLDAFANKGSRSLASTAQKFGGSALSNFTL